MGNEANLFCRTFANVTVKTVKTITAVMVVAAVTAVAAVTEHRLRLRLISANTHFLFLLVTDVTGGESIMAKIATAVTAIVADNKKSFCLHAEIVNNSFSFAPATRIDARLCSRPLPWLSNRILEPRKMLITKQTAKNNHVSNE